MSVSGNEWVPPPGRIDLLEVENAELERHLSDSNAVSGDLQLAYDRLETRAKAAETDAAKLASAVGWLLACLANPEVNRYDGAISRRTARQFLDDHQQLVDARTKGTA